MRKYLFFTVTMLIGNMAIFSQNYEGMKRDSLRIDSLIKDLPTLKDTARINHLNKISRTILFSSYREKVTIEQALPYIELAYQEAKQSDYSIGLYYCLINFETFYGWSFRQNRANKIDNTELIKKYDYCLNELMEVANKINDPEKLGKAYECRAGFLHRLDKKKEKLEAIIMAVNWYKKAGNKFAECTALLDVSYTYLDEWKFENAFEYCKRSLVLAKELASKASPDDESHAWLQLSLSNLADMYKLAGDYESALNILREIQQLYLTNKTYNTWPVDNQFADIYLLTNQVDSAYVNAWRSEAFSLRKMYIWPLLGDVCLLKGQFDSAFYYYNKAIDTLKRRDWDKNPQQVLARSYYGKARVYEEKKQYTQSLSYSKLSISYAGKLMDINYILNNYNIQSRIFRQLGKNDSAYIYLNKYMSLKDSILSRQFLFRINNYKSEINEAKKEATIGFLNRDNKIKEQQLKQEASFKKFLLIGLLLLFIASVFIVRTLLLKRKNEKLKSLQLENELKMQQLESEKRQTEFQKKTTELEMQALRAQMNPHFIFNCLSSINRFILKNEPDTASDYLTRFSRLIRMVLINSQKSLITLEDELDMLTIYLDMERLRFKNNFDYHIVFTNRLDAGAVYIPPLLLQPFCENAIWHGLKHLADPQSGRHELGRLDIELSMDNKALICRITDNGIGRQKAAEIRSKSAEEKKSLGLNITTERLALLNQEKELSTSYEIVDLKDEKGKAAGTSVKLKISLSETIKEPV
jgi:tetratricopeptide (TPR) repeat protein